MDLYKVDTIWLCKLTRILRSSQGHMVLAEFEPTYVLELQELNIWCRDEVPVYKNIVSREEFYNGTHRVVFRPSDIGKTFVTERKRIPDTFLTEQEKESGFITEERIIQLYKELYHSRLFD